MALSEIVIFANVGLGVILILLGAAQRHYHNVLTAKIEEFIEQVGNISFNPSMELGAEAMEMQMQAAKQAQIFDFLRSIVQPNISVKEVERDEAGKFA